MAIALNATTDEKYVPRAVDVSEAYQEETKNVEIRDVFRVSAANRVTFYPSNASGKAKSIVTAILSGDLKMNVKSNWVKHNAWIMDSKVLNTVDGLMQGASDTSIRQPFFTRKAWQGTEPMSITIPLKLLATVDALHEVYLPLVTILTYVVPKKKETNDNQKILYSIPGPSLFADYLNLDDEARNELDGDCVGIKIGNSFIFPRVYIEDVNVTVHPYFTKEGYPTNVEIEVKATNQDANWCEFDGKMVRLKGISQNISDKDAEWALGRNEAEEARIKADLKAREEAALARGAQEKAEREKYYAEKAAKEAAEAEKAKQLEEMLSNTPSRLYQ